MARKSSKPVAKGGAVKKRLSPKAVTQAKFLAAFTECGSITKAARVAGCARAMHYRWMNQDATYPDRYEAAHREAIENLEHEARVRATEGVARLKFHKGELIKIPQLDADGQPVLKDGQPVMVPYVEREPSDLLLIFLLKALKPEIYRERVSVQHGGNVGVQHSGVMVIEQAAASAEEWEKKYGAGRRA